MKNNNHKEEPLWCKMYREQVIKPAQQQRQTQQQGWTEASRAGFYNTKAWKKIRDKRRNENPLCQLCEEKGILRPGKVVDHIIPVDVEPAKALDYTNTQHICTSCHSWKTKEDKREQKQQDKLNRGRMLMKQFETKHNTPGG
ncbi:HNH endonuclease signature motif containing protein [Sunxiuqinia indica]|uniref:HNH endonuclease signature motif containing protein n=1 Tax=Sunxiuqinia indica TaxID=2692584 RepID=UPI0013567EA5|nr:HNH endonuclease signature motif containing protein [Sunxiuqinia indica]